MSEIQNAEKMLDDISLSMVMIDPEDLISLGEFLEKVEKLADDFPQTDSSWPEVILNGLKKAIEAIILDQVKDKARVVEVMGQGVSLLQEIIRSQTGESSISPDVDPFLEAMKTEAGIDLRPDEAGGGRAEAAEAPVVEEPAMEMEEAGYDVGQDEDLFFSFIAESMEHIEAIEVNIIALEQDPEDNDAINSVFRPFHTIKGVSGFLNLKEIHSLTHDVENLLDDARNERLKVSSALIDVVLDAVDILKRMIDDVKTGLETGESVEKDYNLPAFVERIKAIQQGVPIEEEYVESSPYSGKKLGEILLDQGLVSEDELNRLVEAQEKSRLFKLGEILVEQGLISNDDLEEALQLQMEDSSKKIGEILVETGKAPPQEVSRAIEDQEKKREQKIGELLIKEKQAGAREVAGALREQKKAPSGPAGQPSAHTVKVDTTKLDGLVDLVGELVIAQSLVASNERIAGLKDQKVLRDLSHMSRITSELQRTAMSMRMVQIRQTFQKMIRLVRDLSRKSGKMVELEMFGEDTEIDRNMVEAIYDPLVHMVRNSVDHGVEAPETRQATGKPPQGTVNLRAFHQGGNVVIQIEDDGQGLNKDRIFAKAVERGLVGPDEKLSDSAVFNLIFQAGFSTAEKVTDVSGRGVGMDVVKKAIEKLRGKIEVDSQLGLGSTITIRLPLTLAIIDGMIVRVGDNRYILPTVAIHESFRPSADDYHTVKGRGEMIKVRENLLPLVRLDSILGAHGSVKDPTEALVVVVENEGERRCILVDEVLGKQEVVIKSLGERLKYVRALAGGSILGDGRVGLILDIAGVFEVSDRSFGQVFVPGSGPAATTGDWEMDEDWGMGAT